MKLLHQTRFITAAVGVVLLASGVAAAQLAATLSGPVLGYVFDGKTQTLRPLGGILGNATVGKPVETGVAVSQVLTLDASHAIVSTSVSPELVTLNLEATPISTTIISGAPANPSQAVASLQGTTAAFYYADAKQVVIVTGLPQKPEVSHRVELSRFGGLLTHMAVNNDGTLLIYSVDVVAEGGGEEIHGWSAALDSARFLTTAVSVSGLAIAGNGDAIVADRGANEVFAIRDAGGSAFRQFLASDREGVSNPTGVAVGNNNRIYIGSADSVTILDLQGRYVGAASCGCALTGIYPLRDSLFQLTNRIDRTIYLLDASSASERILFVPPAKD